MQRHARLTSADGGFGQLHGLRGALSELRCDINGVTDYRVVVELVACKAARHGFFAGNGLAQENGAHGLEHEVRNVTRKD